jgi:hypothetical protein
MKKGKKRAKTSRNQYVVDRLVNNEERIPTQRLYSDTPYWYNQKKLEAFWDNPSKGIPEDFYAPVSGSPVRYANSLPGFYRDKISEVWIQEFEFSPSAVAFNSYSLNYARPKNGRPVDITFYRRDIITGSFSFKKGRLSGVATSALRGWINSDRGTSYELYTDPAGVSVSSLQDLVDHGSGSYAWANAQISSADTLDALPERLDQVKYFGQGWAGEIFSSNLL